MEKWRIIGKIHLMQVSNHKVSISHPSRVKHWLILVNDHLTWKWGWGRAWFYILLSRIFFGISFHVQKKLVILTALASDWEYYNINMLVFLPYKSHSKDFFPSQILKCSFKKPSPAPCFKLNGPSLIIMTERRETVRMSLKLSCSGHETRREKLRLWPCKYF